MEDDEEIQLRNAEYKVTELSKKMEESYTRGPELVGRDRY